MNCLFCKINLIIDSELLSTKHCYCSDCDSIQIFDNLNNLLAITHLDYYYALDQNTVKIKKRSNNTNVESFFSWEEAFKHMERLSGLKVFL